MHARRTKTKLGACLGSAALVAQLVLGRAARDALLLDTAGPAALPRAVLAASALGILVVLGSASATMKLGPARVVSAGTVLNAFAFVVEALLWVCAPRACAIALYLHTSALSGPLLSIFWSLVNERFDPHSLKRAVVAIGAAGSAGAALGAAAAAALGHATSPRAILATLVAVNALGAFGFSLLASGQRTDAERHEIALSGSLGAVARTALLRHLGAIVLLLGVAESVMDYLVAARVAAAVSAPLRAYGAFHLCIALASVAIGAIASRPSLRRLGLGGTAALLPLGLALTASAGLAGPSLSGVLLERGLAAVLRASLFRSAYEILFTPLDPNIKRSAKVFIDVGIDRVGTAAGSGIAIAALAVMPATTERALSGVLVVIALVALAVTMRLRNDYVRALELSLRSRMLDPEAIPVVDSTTLTTITRTQTTLDREALLREIAAFRMQAPAAKREGDTPAARPLALSLAARALSAPDRALRGTAIEYLEEILPASLRPRLERLFSSGRSRSREGKTRAGGGVGDLGPAGEPAGDGAAAAHSVP